MKANGIHPNGGPSERTSPIAAAPRERSRAAIARSAAAKRRKLEGDREDLAEDDEDDGYHRPANVKMEAVQPGPMFKQEDVNGFVSYGFPQTAMAPPPLFLHGLDGLPATSQPPLFFNNPGPMTALSPSAQFVPGPGFMPISMSTPLHCPSPAQRHATASQMSFNRAIHAPQPQSPISMQETFHSDMFDDFCSPDMFSPPIYRQQFGPTPATSGRDQDRLPWFGSADMTLLPGAKPPSPQEILPTNVEGLQLGGTEEARGGARQVEGDAQETILILDE